MGRHSSSSITKRAQQFIHHWVRTAAPSTLNAYSSSGMGRHSSYGITERARRPHEHQARAAAPSIDSTGYRERRVVFLAKEFTDAG